MSSPSVNIGFGFLGLIGAIGGGIALYMKYGPKDKPNTSPTAVAGGKRHSRRKHHSGRKTRKN